MFCSVCGKQSSEAANFCSSCGAAAAAPPAAAPLEARLVRPRSPRMIAGICSGFAIHYGWDIPLTRILLVVFTFLTSGLGILCYIAAWILIPEAAFAVPAGMVYQSGPPAPVPQTGFNQGGGTGAA